MSGFAPFMSSPAWRGLSLTTVEPVDPEPARRVLRALDPADQAEARAAIGVAPSADQMLLGFLEDVRRGGVACVAWAHAPAGGAEPFAVLSVGPGQIPGVKVGALLAADHRRFARPLRQLACGLRADLPDVMAISEIRRIEARCWSLHPTAARLLTAIGFRKEAEIPGFGVASAPFVQFALTTAAARNGD